MAEMLDKAVMKKEEIENLKLHIELDRILLNQDGKTTWKTITQNILHS